MFISYNFYHEYSQSNSFYKLPIPNAWGNIFITCHYMKVCKIWDFVKYENMKHAIFAVIYPICNCGKRVISHSRTTWIVSINIWANAFPLFFEAESFTDYNLCFILNWHSTPIDFGIVWLNLCWYDSGFIPMHTE